MARCKVIRYVLYITGVSYNVLHEISCSPSPQSSHTEHTVFDTGVHASAVHCPSSQVSQVVQADALFVFA